MFDSQHGIGPVMFRYWSGLYMRGRSQMVVSNGIGNWLPIRINAPAVLLAIVSHEMSFAGGGETGVSSVSHAPRLSPVRGSRLLARHRLYERSALLKWCW